MVTSCYSWSHRLQREKLPTQVWLEGKWHHDRTTSGHLWCVSVKPGSCGALCTWSTLKTRHNIEPTDTAAQKQDWDPLTNHRTKNRRSTEPWESARRAEGRGCPTVKTKANQWTGDELRGSPRKKKKRKSPQRCRPTTETGGGRRLQSCGGCRDFSNTQKPQSQTVSTRQHGVPSNACRSYTQRNDGSQRQKESSYTDRRQPTDAERVQLPHSAETPPPPPR